MRRSPKPTGCLQRDVNGAKVSTTHYCLSSHVGSAAEFGDLVRGHWGIENGCHRVLDAVFREDESRTRSGHAAANLAMVRKVALALLRRAPGPESPVTERLRVGWDDGYLQTVLAGFSSD